MPASTNDVIYFVYAATSSGASMTSHSSTFEDDFDSSSSSAAFNDWCQFDSGPATVTGSDVDAYVSVTRDGSVWLRLGTGGGSASFDWQMVDRRWPRVQTSVIDDETLNVIKSVPYLDYCVLTDVELKLSVQAGWNPSYLTFYDPQRAENRIVSLKVSPVLVSHSD